MTLSTDADSSMDTKKNQQSSVIFGGEVEEKNNVWGGGVPNFLFGQRETSFGGWGVIYIVTKRS